jgi:hypothetical protein
MLSKKEKVKTRSQKPVPDCTLKPGAGKKTVILKAQNPTIVDEKSADRQTHNCTLQEKKLKVPR